MSKEFYDKYGKLVDCFSCNCIEPCSKSDSPLCSEGYVFFAKDKIADLEAKLAESKKKLGQYPYKNNVIEKQYEELKNGIKFRIENNITDDWEQLYHRIDVLCEKHKARIRDIENGICKIEELEKLLNAKEKMKTQSLKGFEKLKQQLAMQENTITNLVEDNRASQEWYKKQLEEKDKEITQRLVIQERDYNQDKISFAVEQLEKVKEELEFTSNNNEWITARDDRILNGICNFIDNQIKAIKEMK